MSQLPEHAKLLIADIQQKIADIEREANKYRETVNLVCATYGHEPMYDLVDVEAASKPGATMSVQPDQFFGKPFSTCVREILTERKTRGMGPADPKEIFEMLRAGGFAFDAKSDDVAFRSMMISIGKNTSVFVKLPGGHIGLEEWYERTRRPKGSAKGSNGGASNEGADGEMGSGPWPITKEVDTIQAVAEPAGGAEIAEGDETTSS
jgi:hypothetical protein